MAMVCGALPIIGKSWVGRGDEAGTFTVSQINSSSCSLLWRGLKPGGRQPAPVMAPTVTGSVSHPSATLTESYFFVFLLVVCKFQHSMFFSL